MTIEHSKLRKKPLTGKQQAVLYFSRKRRRLANQAKNPHP